MSSLFAQILTYATMITGIFWCVDKFVLKPSLEKRIEVLRQTEEKLNSEMIAKIEHKNKWIENFASFFPVLFFVFFVRSFLIEPFQIPSGSMMRTLLIGDFLTVKKYSYGIRNPLNNNVIIPTGLPKRGDVAVFKYPNDPKVDYIKRVIGLPGDKIVYNWTSKELTVYPACETNDLNCVGNQLTPLPISYKELTQSDWMSVTNFSENQQNFYTLKEWDEKQNELNSYNRQSLQVSQLEERTENFGDKAHTILIDPEKQDYYRSYYQQLGLPIGTWIVPAGHYFMMGDDRDYSADSRFWGFVPEANLVGEANFIWMSFEKQPDEWPTGIRLSRIGFIK